MINSARIPRIFSPAKQGHCWTNQESQRVDLEMFLLGAKIFFVHKLQNSNMNSNHILGWNSHFWSVLCLVLWNFLVLSLRPIKTQKCNLIRQHFKNFTFFLIAKTKLEHYVFLSKLKLSTWFLAWEDKWIIFSKLLITVKVPFFTRYITSYESGDEEKFAFLLNYPN